MNRLPVPDTMIDAIIDFLKSNSEESYTSKKIAQHFWDNYTYPDFKTFVQVCAEVNAQIAIHKNKLGRYSQTRVLQITEYQTTPYTYQYKDPVVGTTFKCTQTAFDFNEKSKCIQNIVEEETVPTQEDKEFESQEQSLLVEDVKAAYKINLQYDPDSLRKYLNNVPNKYEVVKEMMQILIEHI